MKRARARCGPLYRSKADGFETETATRISRKRDFPISVSSLYLSMHIHAAVHANRLTGHEVAVVGGEEDDRTD